MERKWSTAKVVSQLLDQVYGKSNGKKRLGEVEVVMAVPDVTVFGNGGQGQIQLQPFEVQNFNDCGEKWSHLTEGGQSIPVGSSSWKYPCRFGIASSWHGGWLHGVEEI